MIPISSGRFCAKGHAIDARASSGREYCSTCNRARASAHGKAHRATSRRHWSQDQLDILRRCYALPSGRIKAARAALPEFSCGAITVKAQRLGLAKQITKPVARGLGFWPKVDKTDGGCWEWLASKNIYGYGLYRNRGKQFMAHRWAYEQTIGPIPEGLDLDHLCRNRACVNPAHLEAVDRRTNLLRGETLTARNAAVTHCPRGHEYSGDNVRHRLTKRGTPVRFCRACSREKAREQKARAA